MEIKLPWHFHLPGVILGWVFYTGSQILYCNRTCYLNLNQGAEQWEEMVESKEQWGWGESSVFFRSKTIYKSAFRWSHFLLCPISDLFFQVGFVPYTILKSLVYRDAPTYWEVNKITREQSSHESSPVRSGSRHCIFHPQDAERERKSSQKRRSPPPAPRYSSYTWIQIIRSRKRKKQPTSLW